jgi:archaetidylserine synthase
MKIKTFMSYADLFSIINASLGFLSIILALDNHLVLAAKFLLIAVVSDALDGWVARRIKNDNHFEFGKNMDSLSDIISFGVAPGILLYSASLSDDVRYINIVVALLILICGILRLSRFNVIAKTRSNLDKFVGLPIPSTALILSSYYISGIYRVEFASIIMIVLSMLMISTLEYPKIRGPKILIGGILIIFAVILPQNLSYQMINIPAIILFAIMILYLLYVPFMDLFRKSS